MAINYLCIHHAAIGQLFYKRTIIAHAQTYDTVITVNNLRKHIELLRPDVFVDSIGLYESNVEILHYHIASEEIEKNMRNDSLDDIFNDTINNYSRLIFKDNAGNKQFNIATIPLTNIIYLQKTGIIIGLSKIVASPYQMVVYSTGGKLLAKRSIKNLLFSFSKSNLQMLCNRYPCVKASLTNNVIIKNGDAYYVEPGWCFTKYINSDTLFKNAEVVQNINFPLMGYGTDGGFFKEYDGFFSTTSPVADVVMAGSVPYMVILNSEDLQRVNIPLLSNCNISTELQ